MDKIKKSPLKAFTVIELLIALVIFSVALLGLIPAVINVTKINHKNKVRDKASMLIAQEKTKLYQLSADNFSSITGTSSRNIIYDNYTFFYTYSVDNETSEIKKTILTITYQDPYSGDNRTINSIIYLRKNND